MVSPFLKKNSPDMPGEFFLLFRQHYHIENRQAASALPDEGYGACLK
jgi:hypothetical protein